MPVTTLSRSPRSRRAGWSFVPSQGGISHDPAEHTAWEDCVNGANVLLNAALRLAEAEPRAAALAGQLPRHDELDELGASRLADPSSRRSSSRSSASAPVGNAVGPRRREQCRQLVQAGVVADHQHAHVVRRTRPEDARRDPPPTRGRARPRISTSGFPSAGATRSSVARARTAVEQSTRSGRTSCSAAQRRTRLPAFRPRGASGRSWSASAGSSQLDFAWRRSQSRFTSPASSRGRARPGRLSRATGARPGSRGAASAIRAIASPSSRPWRTSQQPTTVPVRPTPPQQCT